MGRPDAHRKAAGLVRDLTGWDVQSRVRQHGGDSDLVVVPGWSIEVKRRRSATDAVSAKWWAQAVAQAGSDRPVLLYRVDRGDWRAVWPLAALLAPSGMGTWLVFRWTVNSGLEAWTAVAREGLEVMAQPDTPDDTANVGDFCT